MDLGEQGFDIFKLFANLNPDDRFHLGLKFSVAATIFFLLDDLGRDNFKELLLATKECQLSLPTVSMCYY
jgi:hypothetical protein